MKLDFDIDSIRKNKIELLDCQVELILKSLELYSYNYKFIYPRRTENLTKEENLRVFLVRDTYNQILKQFGVSKFNNPISSNFENDFKKVS